MSVQTAYKPKKTVKSPIVQARVLQKRANGESKTKIAKDLHIARNTVTSVLELNQFEQTLQNEQNESLKLIPAARKAVAHRLALNDGNVGIKVLENTIWPLNDKQGKSAGDPSLVLAIQNLMGNVNVQNSAPAQAISDTQKSEEKTPAPIDVQSSASPAPSEDTKQ